MATPSVPATPAGRCGDARVSHNGDQRCRDASFWNARTRWGDGTPTYCDIPSLIVGNAPLITRYHFGVDFPPPAPVTAKVSSQRSSEGEVGEKERGLFGSPSGAARARTREHPREGTTIKSA